MSTSQAPGATAPVVSGRAAGSAASRTVSPFTATRWGVAGIGVVTLLAAGLYLSRPPRPEVAASVPAAVAAPSEAMPAELPPSVDEGVTAAAAGLSVPVRPVDNVVERRPSGGRDLPSTPPTTAPRTRKPAAKGAAVALVGTAAAASESRAINASAPHSPLIEPTVAVSAPAVPDPREACSKQNFFAKALCINDRCAQPGFASHAECVRLRRAAEDAEEQRQRGG